MPLRSVDCPHQKPLLKGHAPRRMDRETRAQGLLRSLPAVGDDSYLKILGRRVALV